MSLTIPCRGVRGSRPHPPAVIITAGSHTVGVRRGSAHQIDRLGARCTVPKSPGELPELSAGPAWKLQGKHFSRIPCSKRLRIDGC